MLILNTKKAGGQMMRRISGRYCDETIQEVLLIHTKRLTGFGQACLDRILAKEQEQELGQRQMLSSIALEKLIPTAIPTTIFPFGKFYNNGNGQDLRRFLEEVGTDPKEARFWLKHFKRSSESYHPFAVVQVDESIFKKVEENPIDLSMVLKAKTDKALIEERFSELDQLASTLAFLHRNNMKVVIVHGIRQPAWDVNPNPVTVEAERTARKDLALQSMLLASILELHGAPARPLFTGSNIIQVNSKTRPDGSVEGEIVKVNLDPLYWAMQSDHIPIVQSVGESFSGQMLGVDVYKATAAISRTLQPRKVLLISVKGGLTNEKGEVVVNVNLPVEEDFYQQPWCSQDVQNQIEFVSDMLYSLPQQSSVVITAANKLLTELFTHHGSGTFFKLMEPIIKYTSLTGIDCVRLTHLFDKSFGKELEDDFMLNLNERLDTLYLSEDYSAAAIITTEPETDIPYLDKFSVSVAKQSEGTADVLWDMIKKHHPRLYWRSRATNPVNPWYFKRCEGSWSDGQWVVFWYGRVTHKESSGIVNHALGIPSSFKSTC